MLRTAFQFLNYDRAKSLGALLGVVIATFLIGQQAGIFLFLTSTMKALSMLAPDFIWVVDSRTENVNELGRLDMRIRYELESLEGVERVHPLYFGGAKVQFPDGESSAIQLIGLSPPAFAGAPAFIDGTADDLLPEGAVSVDVFDVRAFPRNDLGQSFEINGRQAYIAARTRGVRGFGGVFLFTTINRARALTSAGAYDASAFLVKARPGKVQRAIAAINRNIFGVRAWKGSELAKSTVSIILRTTSIAYSVGALVLFAFIGGLFIVGLTLYSAAVDRLRDYGTMKAIGANNAYLRRLIYTQALIFALLGFLIGFLLILGFRKGVEQSGLLFEFSPLFIAVFFATICAIALGGATLAVRRITRLEPAEVFRL